MGIVSHEGYSSVCFVLDARAAHAEETHKRDQDLREDTPPAEICALGG
jgi:hypothetical protein